MQVAKWGKQLGDVELKEDGLRTLGIAGNSEREKALARMRERGLEAPGYVFDRDEANAR